MLTNNDGTRCCLETVEEVINARCDQQPFPFLGDVLGSDWSAAYGWRPLDPDGFRKLALRAAARSYKNSNEVSK
jgi:hypothetical protein